MRRYVLTDNDVPVARAEQERNKARIPYVQLKEKLWGTFEPRTNKWDRRLLFEIANMRLDDFKTSEFVESDTTDEEGVWGQDNIIISADVPPGEMSSSSSSENNEDFGELTSALVETNKSSSVVSFQGLP